MPIRRRNRTITVRQTKSNRDRVTVLPVSVIEPLQTHLKRVRIQHDEDVRLGFGSVELPGALARKYPNAEYEWSWQYVFPASRYSRDPRSGTVRRHHLFETSVQKSIRRAAQQAGITKPVGPRPTRKGIAITPHKGGRVERFECRLTPLEKTIVMECVRKSGLSAADWLMAMAQPTPLALDSGDSPAQKT